MGFTPGETVDGVYHEPPKAAPKKQYWTPKPSQAELNKIVEEELKPKGKKPVQQLEPLKATPSKSKRKRVKRQEKAWGNQDQFYQGGRQNPPQRGEMRDCVVVVREEAAFRPVLLVVRNALSVELLVIFSTTTDLVTETLGELSRVHALEVVDRGMEDVWIMDSSCSRHMTGHRKWFSSLNPMSTKEYITFGDSGQGKVIRVDLTSVSGPARCLVACPSADIWKWHRRLSHLSFDLLVRLSLMGLIRRLPKLRVEKDLVCHLCRHGKMVAASHIPVSQVMTSYPGKLLHMDTVGPTRVASVGGKWYVLAVVDGFSLFCGYFSWRLRMRRLDLVLRLRNESHKAMRAIGSDNGGEFRNSRFENFYRDLGLEHQFFSPYTPPQNGVVEHKNRTLVEMARTMLDEHRTPRLFWVEAVNTACYIANRIFLRAFLGKTSYELRFGRQPSVKHLRVFGCRCFVLKKAGHLDKSESRCLDGIFLGYASSSRAFRDDEEGSPIFKDEEGAVDDGDAGATAPAAAPAPSYTSSDDDGGSLPTASSLLPQQQARGEASPAEDTREVTSEIVPSRQVQRDHPPHRMIGDIHQRVTRSSVASLAFFFHSAYVASFELRDVSHALSDPNWVNAMHEELENFERNHVWDLVKPPPNCRPIDTKWVFKNKQGENGMIVRNKVRLSAFLNGFIEKEVYVRQPPGFESTRFPHRVYKLRKTLYGLKQAPRAWYARLKSFLLKSGFVMDSVDKTLFLLSLSGDTLIVQIYVDDIIFGGLSHALVSSFAEQMSREFEMSFMVSSSSSSGCRSSKVLRVPSSIKPSTHRSYSRSLTWVTLNP
ncbi:hypothetical protein U9M48_040075 [Paspalum notatum var. saurae]|uniref:Integrase catalytic domain-containing protein n=1 Tax=Paspalum notatum var. saurae TaxID=547442 RepID=A0AAQ3UK92_PASNO